MEVACTALTVIVANMLRCMQLALRQALPWTSTSVVVRRCMQFSVSSLYRKDDTRHNDVLEQGNLPETYATFHVNLNRKIKELLESPTRFQKIGQVENTESGNGNGNGNSEKIVRSKSIYCQRSRWKFDASVLVMGEKCYQSQA